MELLPKNIYKNLKNFLIISQKKIDTITELLKKILVVLFKLVLRNANFEKRKIKKTTPANYFFE
jgi:hypothetical protein